MRSILVIIFCLHTVYRSHGFALLSSPMKVIIDTDVGTDDAVGIFLALAVPEVEVVAITATYGNTLVENVETNILKILTIANRTNIPVYSGAKQPLNQTWAVDDFMGKDGLGDAAFDGPVAGQIDRSKTAAEAMVELASKHPGEIVVLTLAPLTNIATAIKIDPNFTKNVKRFYSMGTKFNFPGSGKYRMDFNYGHDPEANKIFFTSPVNMKTFILSSDILIKRREVSKDWRKNVLGIANSTVVKFLNDIENTILREQPYWPDADSLTTALMIWPELLLDSFDAHIEAIVDGENRGKVIVDPNGKDTGGVVNAEMAQDYDVKSFESKLVEYLGKT